MWTTLAADPTALVAARLHLHWAVQLPAAAAHASLEKREDWSHTNLGWSHRLGALVTHSLRGDLVVGLRVEDLGLLLVREHEVIAEKSLEGCRLDQGMDWLAAAIADATQAPIALEFLDHAMPDHPVQRGALFKAQAHARELETLALWIANAHDLLEHFVGEDAQASAVRLWPHHFDIASRFSFGDDRVINLGFSFGDDSFKEPYAYVGPWPHPTQEGDPPALRYGTWHDDGFFAAVFLASEALQGTPTGQASRFEAFFEQAYDQACAMLKQRS